MWRERLRRKELNKKSIKFLKISKLLFIGSLGLVLMLFVFIPIFAVTLPSPEKVVRKEGFSTQILDRNRKPLYDIYQEQRRTPVSFDEIPKDLRSATVAIEDKNFYKHKGFDIYGIGRAAFNIIFRGKLQGGSTLTQQLTKNVLLSSERTIFRKIKEFVLATQIERKYSKDEILRMYLNEAPYGGPLWGVGVASETYFGKKVSELDLVESAILAGIPQRPSTYSPYSTKEKSYIARTQNVLRRMREEGYISRETEKEALEKLPNVKFQEKGSSFKAPHFVGYIQKILEEKFGENVVEQGGLKVITTLDLDIQEEVQKIVLEEIKKVEYLNITNGAAVVINPETGEILAMVGSKRFDDPDYDGQVNVTTSLRQPGSAFKPFTYVTALKKGYTASTLLMDVLTEFPGGEGKPPYAPSNYDGKVRGPIQVRYALGNSINIPAVKMLAMVGIKDVLSTAYEAGITTLPPNAETLKRVGLSLTLGGGEVRLLDLTVAYSSFMNTGFKVDPISILKIEDSKGKVLMEENPKHGKRVIKEEEAFIIASILSDNEARKEVFGPNSLLNIPGRSIAVKTGTTNDRRDNWTIGGNKQVLAGVWVGNNNNSEMKQVASGVSGASPIWRRILLKSLEGKPNIGFDVPTGIVTLAVDAFSGYRIHDGFAERTEYFVKGTEPGEDTVHLKMKICKSDLKIATPGDISSGNYEEKEFFVLKEEDPTATGGSPNKWQEGILNWLSQQGDSRYHPPTEYCGSSNPVSVEFNDPKDKTSDLSGSFKVSFRADSTSSINLAELYVDGVKIRGFTSPPFEHTLNLESGVHELRAKAKDSDGREAETTIKVGVGVVWDFVPPTPTPIPSPTP